MYDVIIVGSGRACLTTAIYTSSADLKTLVVAGTMRSGQLVFISEYDWGLNITS